MVTHLALNREHCSGVRHVPGISQLSHTVMYVFLLLNVNA
jgi:hypothetical protein